MVVVEVFKQSVSSKNSIEAYNIDFSQYSISPHKVCELGRLIFKGSAMDTLITLYPESDVNKFIAENNSKGIKFKDETNISKNIGEFKRIAKSIAPLSTLKLLLLELQLAWQEFGKLIQLIGKNNIQKDTIEITEEERIKLHRNIRSFFAVMLTIREHLKYNICKIKKTDNGQIQITNDLVDKYKPYQEQYERLKNNTIEKNKLRDLSEFFRNRIEHAGNIHFCVSKTSFPYKNENFSIFSLHCDYWTIAQSDNFPDTGYRYYSDKFIHYMNFISKGFITTNMMSTEDIDDMNFSLRLRLNDKNVNIKQLTLEQIQKYLEDKKFILGIYNFNSVNDATGQYQFDLSECIGDIYDAHIKFYTQLYNWIYEAEKSNIDDFFRLQNLLKNENITVDENVSFKLSIDKNIKSYY